MQVKAQCGFSGSAQSHAHLLWPLAYEYNNILFRSGLQVQQVAQSLAAAPAAPLSPILQQLTGGEPEAQAVFQDFLRCTATSRRASAAPSSCCALSQHWLS